MVWSSASGVVDAANPLLVKPQAVRLPTEMTLWVLRVDAVGLIADEEPSNGVKGMRIVEGDVSRVDTRAGGGEDDVGGRGLVVGGVLYERMGVKGIRIVEGDVSRVEKRSVEPLGTCLEAHAKGGADDTPDCEVDVEAGILVPDDHAMLLLDAVLVE